VELRQVRYFVAIAHAGSYAKAADELHVAKSALSRQIKLLEAELGAELLVRGGGRRDVRLTPAGEAFLPDAVTAVKAMDDGRAQLRGFSALARGTVHIAVSEGWEAWPGWPEMLAEFRRRHPSITLRVTQSPTTDAMLDSISTGEADIAIFSILDAPTHPGLRIEPLHTEEIVLVVPPNHPLAPRGAVPIADLAAEPWIVHTSAREIMRQVTAPYGYEPTVLTDVPAMSMVRSLILSGEGIGVCGESEVEFFRPAATVRFAEPQRYSLALGYREAYGNVGMRAVREFMRGVFAVPAQGEPLAG
jgi:DNA-binding transcriptional LysR family regulator